MHGRCTILKVFPWPHHESITVSKSIPPLILNRVIRWRRVVNFTPQPLYPQGKTAVSIQPEAGLAPESVWTFCRGEKCLQPTGMSAPDRAASSVVAIPTKLLWLPNADIITKGITTLLAARENVVIVVNSWGSPSVAASRARSLARTHAHIHLLLNQDSIWGFCLSGTRHYVIYRKHGALSYTAAKISKFAQYICINFEFHQRKLETAIDLLITSCMRHMKVYMGVKPGFLTLQ